MANGTDGRVYGGDPELVHIADGQRAETGRMLAEVLDSWMRDAAYRDGARSKEEAATQPLCVGCTMIAGFDMLVALAQRNGQSLKELGLTMAAAFAKLAENPTSPYREEITVIMDSVGG